MNLIFLALFDDFASFFNDKVLSNINTSDLSGSNVRDILKSYFEKNPLPEPGSEQFGSNFLLEGITLIIIMFDGGLNLHIGKVLKTAHFAVILVLVGFAISVGIVASLAHYGLGWEWIDSILLGSIVGGSSSIIVFGLVQKIRISDDAKSMLSFESALTDIFAVIIAFVLFEAALSGEFSLDLLGVTIGKAILVGLVLGFGVGIPWMFVISKLKNAQHSYMLTIGMVFLLFFLATSFGESGALTALVFGLMLGKKTYFSRLLKVKFPEDTIDNSLHNQVTFLVRAFFFVFVGLLASFAQLEYVIFGIVAAIAIYIGRIQKGNFCYDTAWLGSCSIGHIPVVHGASKCRSVSTNNILCCLNICYNYHNWFRRCKKNCSTRKSRWWFC